MPFAFISGRFSAICESMFRKYRSRWFEPSHQVTYLNPLSLMKSMYIEGRPMNVVALRSVKPFSAFSSAPSAPMMSENTNTPPGFRQRTSSLNSATLSPAWHSTSHDHTASNLFVHASGRGSLMFPTCASTR